jgi:hypothetical protein
MEQYYERVDIVKILFRNARLGVLTFDQKGSRVDGVKTKEQRRIRHGPLPLPSSKYTISGPYNHRHALNPEEIAPHLLIIAVWSVLWLPSSAVLETLLARLAYDGHKNAINIHLKREEIVTCVLLGIYAMGQRLRPGAP